MTSNADHDEELFRRHVAGMLIVGFQRCWTFATLVSAIPVQIEGDEDAVALHSRCEFMPPRWHFYRRDRKAKQVREFVATEFPKLSAFLIANRGKPDRLLALVPEVAKLRSKGTRSIRLTREETNEMAKIRRNNAAASAAKSVLRHQRESNQRGAWNTCKG